MEEITKKELLEQTKISYGQLYRWKREGLIPEEWFCKRASRTGQETYLPKEKILRRIQFILENKDSHSIDEMAQMLSMQPARKEFASSLVSTMEEIDRLVAMAIKEGEYSRAEVAFLAIVSSLFRSGKLSRPEVPEFISGSAGSFTQLNEDRHIFVAYRCQRKLFGMIVRENDIPVFDNRVLVEGVFPVEELAETLALKYLNS